MLKFVKHILFSIICCLFLISCEKPTSPEEIKTAPVFFLSGSLNGDNILHEAGNNGLYMNAYTAVDSNQVRLFCGTLSNYDCQEPECINAITFIIRDSVLNGNQFNIPVKYYDYRSTVDTFVSGYRVKYQNQTVENSSESYTYEWLFGDGKSSNEKNPTHLFESASHIANSWTNVCLTSKWSTGNSTICADFSVTTEPLADFASEFIGNPSVDPIAFPNYIINGTRWNLNDYGYKTDQPLLTHPGIFKLCVENTYSDGSVNRHCRNLLDPNNGNIEGIANFYYSKEPIWKKDWTDLGKVVIQWVSQSGTIYKSDRYSQPNFASFRVLESTSYTEESKKAQRIQYNLSCRLYGYSENDYVDLRDAEGYFALGK